MAIQKTDIKLMASQRLTDYYDGGGEMTGQEVVDGVVNNLFPDISRLDRVYGRVSLRKAFPAVMTPNTDMYYGGHVIITEPPEDNNVHTTLFSTGDFYDVRSDAKDRVESYVSIAQELLMRPLNDQLEGQRSIACFQQKNGTLPELGQTIVLVNTSSGFQQYVRIMGISVETLEFWEDSSTFKVDVITLDLSAPLQETFPGITATKKTTKAPTRIHATVVADSSKYYGVKKLAQAAAQGDRTLWAESIYNQLVPTSQIETPFIDQLMGGDAVTMVQSGPVDSLTFSEARNQSSNVVYLRSGILPGSLSLSVSGLNFQDADGKLEAVDSDGGYSGTVDYRYGVVTIDKSSSWNSTVSITATPAGAIQEAVYSLETEITLEGRAFNYTPNLMPLPKPGTLVVDYMAQGKWYRLWDNGRGVLVSSEEDVGTGTLNYLTGSVVLTVGALPDVGSSIIYRWGSGMHVTERSGSLTGDPIVIQHTLPEKNIKVGSIQITWGGDKIATDTGGGTLTGDASGTISYSQGQIRFSPNPIPASGESYLVTYEQVPPTESETFAPTVNGEDISFTLASFPIRPGSLDISLTMQTIQSRSYTYGFRYGAIVRHFYDDSGGQVVDSRGVPVGTINYATGDVAFQGLPSGQYTYYTYTGQRYHRETIDYTPSLDSPITVGYSLDVAADWQLKTDTIPSANLAIHLTPLTDEEVVPGSLAFSVGGYTFYDYLGSVYRSKSTSNGSGTLCGNINYTTGEVIIDSYPSMSSYNITLHSLLTRTEQPPLWQFIFRTPGAPVRDGSLSIRATTPDGTLLTSIATTGGVLEADGVDGAIDVATGVVRINFGTWLTAAGNEAEPWYDADDIVGGQIFRPEGVSPETALYNCVLYSFLPLDSDLVGIEPIRLPQDGRVPIYKSGDVVVVHHTQDEALPNGLVPEQVIALARDRLALVNVYDQNGLLVPETQYTVDLAQGLLTMAADMDLTGFTEPLVAAHRIEDMVLVSEAQINGMLSLVGPLTHDYPASTTQVSSALILGDLAARIVRFFHQATWDSVWRDSRSGGDTTAKYNTLNYPLEVTNDGSIAQRWAIKFKSSTTFDVIGERVGIIASGNTSSDCAPINPATGKPYFRIDYRGWGTGWGTNNVLRFDTSAANYPIWLARTTMQGSEEEPTDEFIIQIRGDAN